MSHASIFTVSLLGFALLALAMDRHQEDLFGSTLTQQATRALRIGGGIALLIALTMSVCIYGWSLGLVAYSGHTSATAALVFLALVGWNRLDQRKGR